MGFVTKNKLLRGTVSAHVAIVAAASLCISLLSGCAKGEDTKDTYVLNETEENKEVVEETQEQTQTLTEEQTVTETEESSQMEETEEYSQTTAENNVDKATDKKVKNKTKSSKEPVNKKEENKMESISDETLPMTDKPVYEKTGVNNVENVKTDNNKYNINSSSEGEHKNGQASNGESSNNKQSGSNNSKNEQSAVENAKDEQSVTETPKNEQTGNEPVRDEKPESGSAENKPQIDSEYKLVWEDNFEGDKLNRDDWNVELHEPGWVNQEWQEYVDSDENIYVKDGNLIIQAVKTEKDGKDYYTSGRVNTQNKHDFKYGRFEARAKVPSGKGFLPAFWMMPTDESFYGQWPKCGEIDIMEVLGDKTNTAHGTLHFGEPHTQKQGTYKLETGDFSNDYHVFACEWEPGEMRFYVDDVLYFTENDWFTKRNGFGEVAYPAPYDQPFYMILNVAVGGSWVGYPDETTKFEDNARLVVDYVKVYQKDSYDETVEKPVHEVVLREPDETGNYVNNGDFSKNESLSDEKDWSFLEALGGEGSATISNGELKIETNNAGTADYSIQMVQAGIPLEKGWKYRLSFDAYADEARTMITSVTAPDLNYSRYLEDTKLDITQEQKNYSYEFDMISDSDANGRVEFNLGNQKSTATVYIDNVRLEKVEKIEIKEDEKTVLPDGNYVYNSSFNEGANRMDYWSVDNHCEGAKVFVSNENLVRELKAEVPESVSALDAVILKQSPIALSGGKTYKFTFDARSDEEKTVQARVAGKTFDVSLTRENKTYSFTIDTDEDLNGTELEFLLGAAGTTYIDNVRIQEDGMIVNGDFVNGMVGYEVYVNESAKATYGVDELTEKSAMGFTIEDTGDQDWMIQLKQNNIKLEKNKWYKLSFNAKSDLDRTIMYALQRDGSSDDDWTPYSGTQKIDVNGDYQKFECVFQMKNDTDEQTILSISMGAVNGNRITQKHTVFIKNISLEETEEQKIEEKPLGEELIVNGDFSNDQDNWENAINAPGEADVDFSNGKAVYNIKNVGSEEWHIQLKQPGITLENGNKYELCLKAKSDEARTIKAALLTASYDWYGGADIDLKKDTEEEVIIPIYVDKATDTDITLVVSMGIMEGKDTPVSTIEIDDISLKKVSEFSQIPEKVIAEPEMQDDIMTELESEILFDEEADEDVITSEESVFETETESEEQKIPEEDESTEETTSEEDESTEETTSEEDESTEETTSEEDEDTKEQDSKKVKYLDAKTEEEMSKEE